MGATIERWQGPPPTEDQVEARFAEEGLSPRSWGNRAGDRYEWHEHGYHKVLYCVSGGIVFHTDDGDFDLGPGDRLDVEPGTRHAATVGPAGVQCMEASR